MLSEKKKMEIKIQVRRAGLVRRKEEGKESERKERNKTGKRTRVTG